MRVDDGRVSRVLYSGEKNATLAPNAYCTPIVRTCMDWLSKHPESRNAATVAETGTRSGSAAATVPAGGTSAAPQPGMSQAALPPNVPTATPR